MVFIYNFLQTEKAPADKHPEKRWFSGFIFRINLPAGTFGTPMFPGDSARSGNGSERACFQKTEHIHAGIRLYICMDQETVFPEQEYAGEVQYDIMLAVFRI